MSLPADITGMNVTSATSQVFVARASKLRTRRPLGTALGLVLMSLALTLGVQRVVMAAPFESSPPGALLVRGVDGNGLATSSSNVIDVSGAYPGMEARSSTFEVRNSGTLPVAFAVTSADLVASGPRSLDDVLRISVRDPATGVLLYRGRLSGLRIAHTGVLAAGAGATFTVHVTWPNTAADDAYQGAGLLFSVVATSSVA